MKSLLSHLHPAPFLETLKTYSPKAFRCDLQSGLTVAIFAVPQAMAYAMLAGVPPVYGLYSAMLMSIVAALWGSSEFVNTGPTNSAALLTATALLPFAGHSDLMRILFLLTLMIGILRLLFGLLKFGFLLDFVSESAFIGFTVGAGILIALGQLHHLLGVEGSSLPWFPARIVDILSRAGDANIYPLLIGLGTLAVMVGFNRWAKKVPVAFFAILAATGAAYVLEPNVPHIRIVRDIAPVPVGLPGPQLPLPDLAMAMELLPAAVAIAVIGLVEAVSIAQTLALKHDQRMDFNQEFAGQGLSHIIGAFFQNIPGSGSFSRSVLVEQAGAWTRMSNVFFGLATALALLTIPRLLDLIPIAALSGLLLFIGAKLVDVRSIRRMLRTSRADSTVMFITLFVTVFVKIEYGIFAGIMFSAILYLNRSRNLRIHALSPNEDGSLKEQSILEETEDRNESTFLVLSFGGDLFYGVAHSLRHCLNEIRQRRRPRVLILRMRRAYAIDYSCWSVLFDFAQAFTEQGGVLYLCGVRPDADEIIQSADMETAIPARRIFSAEATPFRGFEKCIESALLELDPKERDGQLWTRFLRNPQAPVTTESEQEAE